MDNEDAGPFRPPDHLVKASQARLARIKALQEDRSRQSSLKSNSSGEEVMSNSADGKSGRVQVAQVAQVAPATVQQMPASTSSPSAVPTSRVAMEIQHIKQAREERRALQEEMKRMREGQNNLQQDVQAYKQMIQQFREAHAEHLNHPPASDPISFEDVTIRVCVRKRPINSKEASSQFDVISVPKGASTYPQANVFVHEPKPKLDLTKTIESHQFMFDHVFDESSSNAIVYKTTTRPLIDCFFQQHGRGTFIAYGQTGSGKSFTVFGTPLSAVQNHQSSSRTPGIFEYACKDIFAVIQNKRAMYPNMQLSIAFFEIYGGKVFDLFNKRQRISLMENKQGQLHLGGMREVVVDSYADLLRWLDAGERSRSTGATEANPESSRSHAIFQLILRDSPASELRGQLSFVDLAGSERASEANTSNRQTRIEGAEINKSLLALKECIRALNNPNAKHVPYRASKLTQVLRDSLDTSNSMSIPAQSSRSSRLVVLVATISPNSDSVEHTLNTLRYANRVKEFKGARAHDAKSEVATESAVYDPYSMLRNQSNESLRSGSNPDLEGTSASPKGSPKLDKKKTNNNKAKQTNSRNNSRKNSLADITHTDYGLSANEATSYVLPSEDDPMLTGDDYTSQYASGQHSEDRTEIGELTPANIEESMQVVMEDEEDLIRAHIITLQETLRICQSEEEELLSEVRRPDHSIDHYVQQLERAIDCKLDLYLNLKSQLERFKRRLHDLQ